MSLTQLSSGRWRCQVYYQGKNVGVSDVLGLPKGTTFATKREAKAAREQARTILHSRAKRGPTVREFWDRWTTDPLFKRPKDSTNIHHRERTKHFVLEFGDREIRSIDDADVVRWIAKHRTTVPSLRAMFNDAKSAKGGRLVSANPFAELGLEVSKGRANLQPPTEEQAREMVDAAHRLTCPSFAGWLQCAMWTGMRPGEVDALTWADVDLKTGWLQVRQQWNDRTRSFTLPKNGKVREVGLNREALEAIQAQPAGEFVFVNLKGNHWRPVSRAWHWNAVRAAVSWDDDLYLATRHFAGWYMINVLHLDSEDVAFQLGHEDGGELVRRLYGHRDRRDARQRVKDAYAREAGGNVRHLRSTG